MTERRSGKVEPESGVALGTKECGSGEVEPESEMAWETTEECRSGEVEQGCLQSHRRGFCST